MVDTVGKKIIVFLLFFCIVIPIFANDNLQKNESAPIKNHSILVIEEQCLECEDQLSSDNDENESTYFSYLDSSQYFISSGLNSLATSLDTFFANKKTNYDSSGSNLRISSYVIFHEGGKVSYSSDINFKLRLPNTEKKFRFIFETDSQKSDDDSIQETASNAFVKDSEKKYFAGLQATSKDATHWRFRASSGVHLTTDLDLFIRLNMDWRDKWGDWNLHWNENPYWFDSTGWGLNSLFELDKKISDKVLFRSSSSARWAETLDSFSLSQVFSVFQILTNKSAISYQAGVYGVSKPVVATTNYLLSMTYRKNIHKDYLFFEITPQINYLATQNFFPKYNLTFKLDMIFKD